MTKDNLPIMLPPAPNQKYIDYYREEEGRVDEKRKQANYEAEVKVYRSLERLDEDIVVLHGLEYTHHQYRLCDTSHDRKKCTKTTKKCRNAAQKEAECDFVVVGENYFVILEVKNIPIDEDIVTEEKTKEIAGALAKSGKQGEKVKLLIRGLLTKEEAQEKSKIFIFSVFPSTARHLIPDSSEKQILCKEDFEGDFKRWWEENVTEKAPSIDLSDTFLSKLAEVKDVLLAIWCTDKSECDEMKCSLGKAIAEINGELERGRITCISKHRPRNPHVIDVTDAEKVRDSRYIDEVTNSPVDIFKNILQVDNLTSEQYDAFSRNQDFLLINGPAGSGKTVILLAKLIQIIKSHWDCRAVLVIYRREHDGTTCARYQEILQDANISNNVMRHRHMTNNYKYSDHYNSTVQRVIDSTSGEENSKVVILEVEYDNTPPMDLLFRLVAYRQLRPRESSSHTLTGYPISDVT